MLENIHPLTLGIPWIVGDLNLIISLEENCGVVRQVELDADRLKQIIQQLELLNINTINGTFSYNNCRGRKNKVAYKIDHFHLSKSLLEKIKILEASILHYKGLDH